MTKLTKLSLAFAIICTALCCIAIAPLIVLAVFAIVTLTCLMICLLIYFFGALIWLFSGGSTNIFSAGPVVYDFAISLFTYMGPVARFSCFYITPYSGFAAIVAGVLGIIISAVALARAKNEPKQEQPQAPTELASPSEGSVNAYANPAPPPANGQSDGIFDPYSVYNAEGRAVREKKEKKPRVKKTKTFKGVCIASLIACIVFIVVAVIAIIVAYTCRGMFV